MSPNGMKAECSIASFTFSSSPPTYKVVFGLVPFPPPATAFTSTKVLCIREADKPTVRINSAHRCDRHRKKVIIVNQTLPCNTRVQSQPILCCSWHCHSLLCQRVDSIMAEEGEETPQLVRKRFPHWQQGLCTDCNSTQLTCRTGQERSTRKANHTARC